METFLEKLRNGRKVTIVALGDSITEQTWHTRGRQGWVGLLQEALFETYGRNRCWVINSGRCGDRATTALDRFDEDVARFGPDLVIVSFGMNDSGGELEDFRAAMVELVRRSREAGAEVLLRTPNPMVNPPTRKTLRDGQKPSAETGGSRVGEFARAVVEIASAEGCAVVDHYSSWKALEDAPESLAENPNRLWLLMSDPVHPGALGHLRFFRELAPVFGVAERFPWE